MQTEEFMECVNDETAYSALVSLNYNYIIEIIDGNGNLFLSIDLVDNKIVFNSNLYMTMDDNEERPLLDLLSEYSITQDKEIPYSNNNHKVISEAEYDELKTKSKKLEELEKALTGSVHYEHLPFY